MAEIAIGLEQALSWRRKNGAPGATRARVLARGDGWTAADVVCTCGPQDRSYEEWHCRYTIAMVLAGSFQYRSALGSGLMTAGSLMLGNQGHCFECAHQHGEGDRCLSFWYTPDYFEWLAADAGAPGASQGFTVPRLPPLRPVSPLFAQGAAGALGAPSVQWEELAMRLAVQTVSLASGTFTNRSHLPLNAEARVSRAVRAIDRHPGAAISLRSLAREAGLSPYHFLRTFDRLTGITPHQYMRRRRLREAATRLVTESQNVIDVALDCGFGDVSNFNRAFREEFGVSPRAFRRANVK